MRLTLCEWQKKLDYEVPHLKLETRRRVDKLQVNEFFCVLQSAGFAGQVLQVDPISVIANNYNIYERSRQEDFGSTRKKDQEETEDTVDSNIMDLTITIVDCYKC